MAGKRKEPPSSLTGRERSREDDDRRSADASPDQGRDINASDGGGDAKSKKEKQEEERRSRMARLRAENEAEERRLAAVDNAAATAGEGGEASSGGANMADDASKANGIVEVKESELEGMDQEEQMRMLLGFSGGFSSTKGEAVEDNKKSAARGVAAKNKARKYRQYMNRKGGFNRPLDKMP